MGQKTYFKLLNCLIITKHTTMKHTMYFISDKLKIIYLRVLLQDKFRSYQCVEQFIADAIALLRNRKGLQCQVAVMFQQTVCDIASFIFTNLSVMVTYFTFSGQCVVIYWLNKERQDSYCWSLLSKYKETLIFLLFINQV